MTGGKIGHGLFWRQYKLYIQLYVMIQVSPGVLLISDAIDLECFFPKIHTLFFLIRFDIQFKCLFVREQSIQLKLAIHLDTQYQLSKLLTTISTNMHKSKCNLYYCGELREFVTENVYIATDGRYLKGEGQRKTRRFVL